MIPVCGFRSLMAREIWVLLSNFAGRVAMRHFRYACPGISPPLLATGAELKNTFCLTHGEYVFLSQHIGDIENFETPALFRRRHTPITSGLFHVQPEIHRLRPASKLPGQSLCPARRAVRRDRLALALGVQHHHAHLYAALDGRVRFIKKTAWSSGLLSMALATAAMAPSGAANFW